MLCPKQPQLVINHGGFWIRWIENSIPSNMQITNVTLSKSATLYTENALVSDELYSSFLPDQ